MNAINSLLSGISSLMEKSIEEISRQVDQFEV